MRLNLSVYSPSATEVFVDNARLFLPTHNDESDVITAPTVNVYIILCVQIQYSHGKNFAMQMDRYTAAACRFECSANTRVKYVQR